MGTGLRAIVITMVTLIPVAVVVYLRQRSKGSK